MRRCACRIGSQDTGKTAGDAFRHISSGAPGRRPGAQLRCGGNDRESRATSHLAARPRAGARRSSPGHDRGAAACRPGAGPRRAPRREPAVTSPGAPEPLLGCADRRRRARQRRTGDREHLRSAVGSRAWRYRFGDGRPRQTCRRGPKPQAGGRRRRIGRRRFSLPPSSASRLALSRAISASSPNRTSEVFSRTPVRWAARLRSVSSMFNVVRICTKMHVGYIPVKLAPRLGRRKAYDGSCRPRARSW